MLLPCFSVLNLLVRVKTVVSYVADNAVRGEILDGVVLKHSNHRSVGYRLLHAKVALCN